MVRGGGFREEQTGPSVVDAIVHGYYAEIVKLAELIDTSEEEEKRENPSELPVKSVTVPKKRPSVKLKSQLSEFFLDFISTYEDSPLVKTEVAKEIMNSLN
jgi:hypothetical protein